MSQAGGWWRTERVSGCLSVWVVMGVSIGRNRVDDGIRK